MKSRLDLHQTHLTYGLDFMGDGLNWVTLKVIINIYKHFHGKSWIFSFNLICTNFIGAVEECDSDMLLK